MTVTNEEIELITTQIGGLESRIKALGTDKDLFIKAQGLDEAAEKRRAEIEVLQESIKTHKDDMAQSADKRLQVLETSFSEIKARMNKILPSGAAGITIEEGKLLIGWAKDDVYRPYEALSGGEKIAFDAALSYVLLADSQNKVLMMEAAELDDQNLVSVLNSMKDLKDTQIFIFTCHHPVESIDGWTIVGMV